MLCCLNTNIKYILLFIYSQLQHTHQNSLVRFLRLHPHRFHLLRAPHGSHTEQRITDTNMTPTVAPPKKVGRGTTLLRGLTNHGYKPLTKWDDSLSRWWFQIFAIPCSAPRTSKSNNTLPMIHSTNTVRSTRPLVSNMFYFHPNFGEDKPIFRSIFFKREKSTTN